MISHNNGPQLDIRTNAIPLFISRNFICNGAIDGMIVGERASCVIFNNVIHGMNKKCYTKAN